MSWLRGGTTSVRKTLCLVCVGVLISLVACPGAAVSPAELPPALQALPMADLLGLFSVTFEEPNYLAEVARLRAWAPPVPDEQNAGRLVEVIHRYPRTAAARRALLDLAGIYARKGDWVTAQSPFYYVMEVAEGKSEARIARLRLLEMYRHWGTPDGVNPISELQEAIRLFSGTPEEGFAHVLLGDFLNEQDKKEEAYAHYRIAAKQFPRALFANYARVRHSLALSDEKRYPEAREVLGASGHDPIWSGRALLARAEALDGEGDLDKAIADCTIAAETGDVPQIRGEAYRLLGELCSRRGLHDRAADAYRLSLVYTPLGPDRLERQLSVLKSLAAAGRNAEASAAAASLEMEVLNSSWCYSPEEMTRATHEIDSLLAEMARNGSRLP